MLRWVRSCGAGDCAAGSVPDRMSLVGRVIVGAGLLANAVGQSQWQRMTESLRQQAGSYRFSGE